MVLCSCYRCHPNSSYGGQQQRELSLLCIQSLYGPVTIFFMPLSVTDSGTLWDYNRQLLIISLMNSLSPSSAHCCIPLIPDSSTRWPLVSVSRSIFLLWLLSASNPGSHLSIWTIRYRVNYFWFVFIKLLPPSLCPLTSAFLSNPQVSPRQFYFIF